MARTILAALITLLALSGCERAPVTPALDHGWAPPGACMFIGNRADRHYCSTTGTQILANPLVYDGQLVDVSGWVIASPDGEDVALFLTRDALDTAVLRGSVSLVGPEKSDIASYANRASAHFTPVQVRVSGRFRLHGLGPDGSPKAHPRFGAIEEVSLEVP